MLKQQEKVITVRDFNRNNRDSNRGGRRFDSRAGGNQQMHQTTCSQCGNDCKVPFRPTGDKPVYCSKCFGERSGGDSRGSYNRNARAPLGSGPNYQSQFDAINQKLDTILETLTPKKKLVKKKPTKKKSKTSKK